LVPHCKGGGTYQRCFPSEKAQRLTQGFPSAVASRWGIIELNRRAKEEKEKAGEICQLL